MSTTTIAASMLRKFSPQDRALVRVSTDTGWVWKSKGMTLVGVSPDGSERITLGTSRRRNADLLKVTPQQQYDRWLARRLGPSETTSTPASVLLDAESTRILPEDQAREQVTDQVIAAAAQHHLKEAIEAETAIETLKDVEEELVRKEPAVVSEQPWLARKTAKRGGGERYKSGAVVERHWSNGRVDFVCSYPDCGWSSDIPRSVASHYASSHGAERPTSEAARQRVVPAPDYTEPLTHHTYNPTDRLVHAVLSVLTDEQGRLRPEWVSSPKDLATAVLTWMHDRPDLPEPEAAVSRPLTSDEIVDRIRVLVGGPLITRVEELERQVAERDAEINRLKGEWRAALDVLAEGLTI